MSNVRRVWVGAAIVLVGLVVDGGGQATAAPFTAVDRADDFVTDVVLQYVGSTGRGFDWAALQDRRLAANKPEYRLRQAVEFFQEGITRLTGKTPTVRSGADVQRGIVVMLLRNAPRIIAEDSRVQAALANDGSDAYNHREAFYLRSERERLLIVANTIDGLVAALPALLERVGYEVLAMGPNWTHVPTGHRERLVFDVERSERPSYYLRQLTATTGQSYGVGTLMVGPKLPRLADEADESVSVSYARWQIGTRMRGRSMDPFPGHALYQYHRRMAEEMVRTGSTVGFLTPGNHLGLSSERPPADESNRGHLWINTDPRPSPEYAQALVSDGTEWKPQKPVGFMVNLDPTAPAARAIVLAELKERALKHFAALAADRNSADEPLIFGTESEDGAGLAHIGEWAAPENRNWYVDYLKAEGIAYPQPYVLDGYRGIAQPREAWDISTPGDTVFGFNNWLLREFDKWIDSLPEADRVTAGGAAKKDLVRCSCYSYAFHDVPPHINPRPAHSRDDRRLPEAPGLEGVEAVSSTARCGGRLSRDAAARTLGRVSHSEFGVLRRRRSRGHSDALECVAPAAGGRLEVDVRRGHSRHGLRGPISTSANTAWPTI